MKVLCDCGLIFNINDHFCPRCLTLVIDLKIKNLTKEPLGDINNHDHQTKDQKQKC
jgi:hypothetical protein